MLYCAFKSLNEKFVLNSEKFRKLGRKVHAGPLIKRKRKTACLYYSVSLAINRGETSAENILLIKFFLNGILCSVSHEASLGL